MEVEVNRKPAGTKLTIMALLGGVLCAQSPAAVADEMPAMDVRVLCRAEAQDVADGPVKTCLADEERARAVLHSKWTQFATDSRATCVNMATETAGLQSYVELLSCLEIAKDAKSLPAE